MSKAHKKGNKIDSLGGTHLRPDFPKVLPGIQICKGKPNITTTEGTESLSTTARE